MTTQLAQLPQALAFLLILPIAHAGTAALPCTSSHCAHPNGQRWLDLGQLSGVRDGCTHVTWACDNPWTSH